MEVPGRDVGKPGTFFQVAERRTARTPLPGRRLQGAERVERAAELCRPGPVGR